MNEIITIPIVMPIVNNEDVIESIRLYFENVKYKKLSDSLNQKTLEIELNNKFKIRLYCQDDVYIYRENGILKLGGVESIENVYYNGNDVEII